MTTAGQINTLDPNSLANLKRLARDNSPEALRAAAQQFEGLFLQMVLKSMRDATPAEGMFDSEQGRMYQSMLDQQLAMNMAQSRSTGLADALVRQLGGPMGPEAGGRDGKPVTDLSTVIRQPAMSAELRQSLPALAEGLAARRAAARLVEAREQAQAERAAAPAALPVDEKPAARNATRAPAAERAERAAALASVPASSREFVDRMWPHAVEASRATGIPARFLIAHAALETGWGRAEIRHADGRPSYNLFNIKAGKAWDGETVTRGTTEYAQGRAYREQARFRSYDSYAEAFKDYARLLTESPRYAHVVGQRDAVGFARGLQRSGYATDPMYADKLVRVIDGKTMRVALANLDTTRA